MGSIHALSLSSCGTSRPGAQGGPGTYVDAGERQLKLKGPFLITVSKLVLDTALVDGRFFRQDMFALKGEK